jgi:diguanylate cyclase (GGDEF)-like protein
VAGADLTKRDKHPRAESCTAADESDDAASSGVEAESGVEPDPKTSEFDQRRWGRGHAALDRERAAELREAAAAERDRAQAASDAGTRLRRGAADGREHAAADRDEHASERDRSQAAADQRAGGRSGAADDREHAVADRHHAAEDRDQSVSDRDVSQAAADQRAVNRSESARDSVHATSDREAAIEDRAGADRDYGLRRADLRRAQLDQLTGAFGREIGLSLLDREIDRARHGNGHLVLAYIDVDGLKQVNDGHGHGAGDALLRDVVAAIQRHMRSYDTLVRVGGDEFVCGLSDCTRAVAGSRFEEIRATMRIAQPHASLSVGFAELRPGDTLDELTKRGDAALYQAKRRQRRG